MPVFDYRGLARGGKEVRGSIDAESARTARSRLKKDGVFVTEMVDKKKLSRTNKKGASPSINTSRVPIQDLSLMTRQLASLLKANIPLVDALAAVGEQVEHPALSHAILEIKNSVNEGGQFFKALQRYPNLFNNIFVTMCEAGEATGTLDSILLRLAEFTESQHELRTRVRGALTYPVIMLVASVAILGFLCVFLIPTLANVFESFPDFTLPWYTKFLLDLSAFVIEYWYIIVGLAALAYFLARAWARSPKGKSTWDRVSLRLPVFGEMKRMVAVSRFTRTLATLLTGGVPMLQAMGIVRNVVDNEVIANAIDDARSNISEGETIVAPLRRSGQFPPLVLHMINIGEKTGELENMLTQVADAFDFQVKTKIAAMTSIMGPVVLILMGAVIGFIVFAVMMPMFELTNAIT